MPEREGLTADGGALMSRRLRVRRSDGRPATDAWEGPHADRYPAMKEAEVAELPEEARAEREARIAAHEARVQADLEAIRYADALRRLLIGRVPRRRRRPAKPPATLTPKELR